jgi:hypothetical protein
MPVEISYESLLELDPEYLQGEISRLELSISHLKSSNDEMAAFHREEPDDIFPESIQENEGVMCVRLWFFE